MEQPMSTPELKALRWRDGKEAVAAIQRVAFLQHKKAKVIKRGGAFRSLVCSSHPSCGWTVNLSRSRSKHGPGDWHVTVANIEHRNCLGSVRPTHDQVASHPVTRAAVATNVDASAQSLVTQLRHQAGISCSTSMVYRAKQKIISELFFEDPTTISMLPSFLFKFRELNPQTFTELDRDVTGQFRRAIIILDPAWFSTGQQLYGVDAAHMKHRKYSGVQIVMVGRDGNLKNRVAAVALAPTEDHNNYLWFFSRIMTHGFNLSTVPVFSDRHQGIVSATAQLSIFSMYCVRHIIGNMRSDKAVRLPVSQEKFVWAANASVTADDFSFNINELAAVNPNAAEYLNKIPATKWALYPHFESTKLYGWRTTNFVESEQARSLKLKPRLMLPFEYFKAYALIMMGEAHSRVQAAETWQSASQMLTPRAEQKLQHQIKEASNYCVIRSSASVAFVSRVSVPMKQRRVQLTKDSASCSCLTWVQHGIVCRHIVAVSQRNNGEHLIFNVMDACYTTAHYSSKLVPIEIPKDTSLVRDDALLPAAYHQLFGRPNKRRIGSRGETGRTRKQYRCSKCDKADGHNSATCRAA